MAVQSAKNKFMSTEPLCLTCANAVPQACEFIRQKKPAPALEAMGAKYLSQELSSSHNKGIYYKVISCPNYTRGPLPRIATRLDKAAVDITCPKCGGAYWISKPVKRGDKNGKIMHCSRRHEL